MRFALLSVILVLALASGCGAVEKPAHGSRIASGVKGRVLVSGGPLANGVSPTARPCPGGEVTATDSAGAVVARVVADAQGGFEIALPPGAYALHATATSGNLRFTSVEVSVTAGGFVHADIVTRAP